MDNGEIKKDYLKKIKKITKLNEAYYNHNNPLISDFEYDLLKKQILSLEKKHVFLDHKNSPSKTIGFSPSKNFKKVEHRLPMLSLSNAFNEEDLINFEKKIINFLSLSKLEEIE